MPINDHIIQKVETKRGCGYRKAGGIYLVCDAPSQPCYKEIPLKPCPTCKNEIRFSQNYQWIHYDQLLINDKFCRNPECRGCVPFDGTVDRMLLMWVGEMYYSMPHDFRKEAFSRGISKRIPLPPKDIEVGKTWVVLVHKNTIPRKGHYVPGIFMAFVPTRIEYVVKGNESDEQLKKLLDKGYTLIKVKKAEDLQMSLL
jgi:hypothetical protein